MFDVTDRFRLHFNYCTIIIISNEKKQSNERERERKKYTYTYCLSVWMRKKRVEREREREREREKIIEMRKKCNLSSSSSTSTNYRRRRIRRWWWRRRRVWRRFVKYVSFLRIGYISGVFMCTLTFVIENEWQRLKQRLFVTFVSFYTFNKWIESDQMLVQGVCTFIFHLFLLLGQGRQFITTVFFSLSLPLSSFSSALKYFNSIDNISIDQQQDLDIST